MDPSSALDPRSWGLESIHITEILRAEPELRHLWSSVASILTTADLGFKSISLSFAEDLLHLPSTLLTLKVKVGWSCSQDHFASHFQPIKLTSTLDHFPNLQHLELCGDLVDEGTLSSIARLTKLKFLRFGDHASITSPALLSFLGTLDAPPLLPLLRKLVVDLCSCDVRSAWTRAERAKGFRSNFMSTSWPPGMSLEALNDLCAEVGRR